MNTTIRTICLFTGLAFLMTQSDCRAHDDHGHNHSGHNMSVEEIFSVECEHDMAQHACAECRYELGLVKLDPDLMHGSASGNELFRTDRIGRRDLQQSLSLNGEIALNATRLTHVSPRISGVVQAIHAQLSDVVNEGDVLFEIESPELGIALGTYRKNKALAELTRQHVEREKTLVEQKLSSRADLVEAMMRHEEYRIELESAHNILHTMGLSDELIAGMTETDMTGKGARLPVRAPQSGTVIEFHLEQGETLEAGKEIITIADLSSVWLWMSVYERDLERITEENRAGEIPLRIKTLAFKDRVFEGKIDLIGSLLDVNDRTVKVRATLDNADRFLRPGMFCTVDALFRTDEAVLAAPRTAVLSDEGHSFVFRIVRDGYALRTDIETGRTFGDWVEILEGLDEGQQIITAGAFVCKSDVLREKMGAGCAD